MILELPKIYPITDIGFSGLSHTEQVERLAAGGATFIQMREKNLPPAEFFGQAITAVQLARQLSVRIIINDRADVALATKADGVHLGQDDLPAEAARRILGNDAIIGYSTHNLDQAKRALSLPIDYLAIGPIFATTSKTDTEPVVGLDGLRSVARIANRLPIVAIGGITFENVHAVIEAGATSVAVISALLAEKDSITERTRQLFEHVAPGN
ncbi:MAG TPA: thiamine phosphate synthase [Pyrinomonadaceae bacterium]|nr:thiamine phosphate synthase [Pyrinomonadaceae bacterium]